MIEKTPVIPLVARIFARATSDRGARFRAWQHRGLAVLAAACCFLLALGPVGAQQQGATAEGSAPAPANGATGSGPGADSLVIREGDVLKITFPGTPNLDNSQQVRRDGRITLAMIGEVMAAGMTPVALEKDLIERYSTQLVSKEVIVTVVSSSYSVYVSGAVLRPGKYVAERPLTALEAIMEAGGFDPVKANARKVVVIRQENGKTKNYTLNLKVFLEGKPGETFYLRTSDILYVPEKFTWW